MRVFILVLVIRLANLVFSSQHYCVIYALSFSTMLETLSKKLYYFRRKFENK